MSGEEIEQWRKQMHDKPIKSCGRLDLCTYLPEPAKVGRVKSDCVRYVYFEDGSECVVLGDGCDFVAYRAADWAKRDAEINRLRHSLAIYVHAHETGNFVPPRIESEAKELCKEATR